MDKNTADLLKEYEHFFKEPEKTVEARCAGATAPEAKGEQV
jgi:hypothetical protein